MGVHSWKDAKNGKKAGLKGGARLLGRHLVMPKLGFSTLLDHDPSDDAHNGPEDPQEEKNGQANSLGNTGVDGIAGKVLGAGGAGRDAGRQRETNEEDREENYRGFQLATFPRVKA